LTADQAAYRAKRDGRQLYTQCEHRKNLAKISTYDLARHLCHKIENRPMQPADPSDRGSRIMSFRAALSASTTLLGLSGLLVNQALAGPAAVRRRRTH
jgi:hypothetical protein